MHPRFVGDFTRTDITMCKQGRQYRTLRGLLVGVITHVSCDQAQPRLSLALGLTVPLLDCLFHSHHPSQSHFRPPALIGYSHLACVYLSSRNVATLHGHLQGTSLGNPKVLKLGSLQRQCMNLSHPIPLRARWIRYPALCPTLLVFSWCWPARC
jgi:hypothetical protein